jgi:hypothetical protein
MARIIIPRNFEMQNILGGEVLKRHKELGDKSPLIKVFDMKDLEGVKISADAHNTKKDELEKLAENETELRDKEWDGAVTVIRNIAQFLKAMYVKNPHELGKWGFEVDSSPQKKKEQSS